MLFKNATLFYQDTLQKLDMQVENGRIVAIGQLAGEGMDYSGKRILPGLVDIHSHGGAGLDFCQVNTEEIDDLCSFYGKNGVTAVCATGMTLDFDQLKAIFFRIGRKKAMGTRGAKLAGINMEGPFLSYDKKGAHNEAFLAQLDIQTMEELLAESDNSIRLIDINPMLSGAKEFIAHFSKKVVISLAHTSSDYETAMAAIANGASNVTHLFNAMNGLHHREPGLIGAAFDSDVTAEIICDGIHIHPAVVRVAFKILGKRGVLVSDSMSAAGMPEGAYDLGGLAVTVKEGKAFLADGTIAGSTITLLKGLQNAIAFGIEPEKAIYAATVAPATAIRCADQYGSLEVGRTADFIVLDEGYSLEEVYIDGSLFHKTKKITP